MGRYALYLIGGSVLALGVSTSVCAKAGDAAQTAGVADTAAPAAGEIVVTANKREQNLNNVGLSISALGADALRNQRISDVSELAKVTPGLVFAPTPNATPVYTLRGVGFFETTLAAYPDVSLYLDQVPLSLPVMSALTAFDLERVEVLKGPQGTLFGNNATGGAINFVAAKPTKELHFGADISYGRFNTIEGSAFVSGPLTDTLRGRIAFKVANGDDWQKSYTRVEGGVSAEHLALGVPDSTDKRQDTLGKRDNIAGRLILDWTPSDSLRFSLNVNGWRNQDDPQAPQYYKAVPQNPVRPDFPVFNYPIAPFNARAADWSTAHRPFADHKFFQTSLRTDYDLFSDHTLTSITAFNKMRFLNATSGGGANLDLQDLDTAKGRIRSFSQELRLANGTSNAIRYTLGLNYEHTKVLEDISLYMDGTSASEFNGFGGNQYGSDQRMHNYAAFGNLEYDLGETITLKAGIRQTKAKRSSVNTGSYEIPGFFTPDTLGPNSLTRFFNLVYAAIYGEGVVPEILPGQSITLDTRLNPDGTPVDPATYLKTGRPTGRLNENSTSWSLGADFKPVPGLLLYANVSKGYKAGSFPTLAGAIYSAFDAVKQEELLDIEAGFKAQLFNRRLSITGAAFNYNYKNKQLRAKFVDPIFGALDTLLNVPKSRVRGAELGFNGRPIDGLTVSASATYLDAQVKRYIGVVGSVPGANGLREPVFASFAGVDLPFSPKFQFTARVDYEFPLSNTWNGFVGAGANGQTKSIGVLTTSAEDRKTYQINGRVLIDLSAGITTSDGAWRVGVWGKNVFDKYYVTNTIQAYDNIMRYAGRPAEYGVNVGYRF